MGKATFKSSVVLITFILNSLDVKKQRDVILIDLRKVFDTVYYGLLVRELGTLSIGNPLQS